MLIFYPVVDQSNNIQPVVIIDALSSDDRYTVGEIDEAVKTYAPEGATLQDKKVFSCEYEGRYEHVGIPLSAGIKASFSGFIKSPPADLISAFSPKFFTSAKNFDDMASAVDFLANPQTTVTYTAFCVRGLDKRIIARKFVTSSAPINPDPFGSTTTMYLKGGSIEDIMIKSEIAYQFNKKETVAAQIDKLLKPLGLVTKFISKNANKVPVADKLYPPTTLNKLLDDFCIQNKLVYGIKDKTVTFYSQGPDGNPKLPSSQEFSFIGTKGNIAYNPSVENYSNIKFKSVMFDAELFQTIRVYNDIKSAFFSGLSKVSEPPPPSGGGGLGGALSALGAKALATVTGQARKVTQEDAYECYIIRYSIMWSRRESCTEVTAANNWLLAQFRLDSLLDTSVFKAALK